MSGGWQTQVYDAPAAAVAGDRASKNPIINYDAGPGGLVAGAGGAIVGHFAWVSPPLDADGGPTIVTSFGAGNAGGFVMRNMQASQPNYLANAGMTIQSGYEMALMVGGDFWVKNDGTTEALRGQKAYANFLNGSVSFAATASPVTGASATGSTIQPETFSVTGSIAADILTVTAIGSGTLYPGSTISGTNIASGTQIVSQLSGTAGGIGTYRVSIPEQTVASTTVSGTYGLFTIGTLTTTPVFSVGDYLNATGSVVAGTQITANVAGAGGTGGTMIVNNNTNVTSQTILAASNVETPFFCLTTGLPGELVKMGRESYSTQLS
jgi:hypothetical protein